MVKGTLTNAIGAPLLTQKPLVGDRTGPHAGWLTRSLRAVRDRRRRVRHEASSAGHQSPHHGRLLVNPATLEFDLPFKTVRQRIELLLFLTGEITMGAFVPVVRSPLSLGRAQPSG
jgi:hypothetical protein